MSLHSYPSIYNMGHKAIADLLKQPVYVQEKVDGSQISFGIGEDGELYARSKGCALNLSAPDKMFSNAVATIKDLAPLLTKGYTYRGEYLAKPHHNALTYSRIPNRHIILFDINDAQESYLSYESVSAEATRLGLEVVPLLYTGTVATLSEFRNYLENTSILGGQKIEGVVIKPVGYDLFGRDKKCLMGKFVSEAFKEVHSKEWAKENPSSKDVIALVGDKYTTPARWAKAVQHLRELGGIADDPRDIGLIMAEVPTDVLKECEQQIKDELFAWAWPHIKRHLTRGLPQWYKDELLKRQFNGEEQSAVSQVQDSSRV